MNKQQLRLKCLAKGFNVTELPEKIGISKATFYRKCKSNEFTIREVKEIKDKYVKMLNAYKASFETLSEGCETQDEATINTGNEKLEEALELLDDYNKALEDLAKEHGSEVEY